MPDIFDEVETAPSLDIFDEVSGDVFDQVEPGEPPILEVDEAGLPVGISPRERKALELSSQIAAGLLENEKLNAEAESLASQERTYQAFSRPVTTAINLPGRIMAGVGGVLDHYEDIYTPGPKISIPRPTGTGVGAGLGRLAANLAEPFTDPDEAFKLIGAANPAGRALMAAQMVQHVPEHVERGAQVAGDISSTPADVVEAVGEPVITAAMLAGLAHARAPKRGEAGFVADVPEFKGLPDPDLVARNLAAPGTIRPQEQQRFSPPRIDPEVYQFEAGNVPFERMKRMGVQTLPPVEILPKMGRIENVPILEETRPKEQRETRGKVSFGAEAPVLLRNAVEQAESVGLMRSAEAARKAATPEVIDIEAAPEPIKAMEPVESETAPAPAKTAQPSRDAAASMTPEAIAAEMATLEKQIAELPKPTSPEGVMEYLNEKTKLSQRRSFLQEAQGIQAEPKSGIISGSKAEAWADDVLRGGGTHAGPDVIAAYAIKGAAIIERGVTDFAKWSEEMVRKHGPEIRDSLKDIYAQSVKYIDREKSGEAEAFSGEGKMRKSAARATNAEMIPEPVQERIAGAPESRYEPQSMNRVESQVGSMADTELGTVGKDTDIYTAAKLEQARRLFEKGDNDAGYNVFVELEKEGTRLGQLINQFKLLNGTTPEQVAGVINTGLKKAGKDGLTPKQTVEAIKIAKDAKGKDAVLDAATEAWKKEPTLENAAKAEKALDESNKAALELQKFTAKYTPRTTSSILKSVLQGNLLTPISETANLVGNMSFLPFRAATRGLATGMDIIDSYITGKPRELSVGPVSGTVEAGKGVVRGAKQIPGILAHGSGDVIKGETRTGLHPMRAWVDQFSKNPERPTTGGKLKLQDRVNLLIEGTFGVPAEAMLRGLGAGDAPFREAARGRVIAEQLRLKKLPKDKWAFAEKFPELFFDKETVAQIGRDTAAAVFQRESKTLSLLTRWLSGKGDVLDFAAATVAPYKLTPWNIIGEVLSYNPLVAMGKTLYESKQGNRREAKINAGKMLVGSMMAASAAWLYQKGLIAPSLDERDEAQKARILSGQVLPPNHINISGLKRALEGGDPSFKAGDETRDFFRSGGLAGSMLYMTANVGREFERKPEDESMIPAIIRQSTLEQARFGLNQSFLQGVEGLLTAIKEGNPDNYLRQWFSTVLSIPLPNTMSALSRATRDYKPDFREDEFKNQVGNVIRNRMGFAGLDDYLPLKRDFWGKPLRETPEGRNALFYHFFDVTKGKQVTDDPVALELYRLWRTTADAKVIPSLVNKQITQQSQTFTLDAAQQSRYAELVGEERRRIVDAMVINPNFHKLNNEQKIKVLNIAYDRGLEIGKLKFLKESPALEPKKPRAGF